MFKSLWNIAHSLVGKKDQQKREEIEQLARMPLDELLPRWIDVINSHSDGVHAKLRPSPSEAAILAAEEKLHASLPPELLIFYSICNGVEVAERELAYPLSSIESLRRCGEHVSPLSGQLRSIWKNSGYQAKGFSPNFAVYPTRMISSGNTEPESEISFLVTDQMLALETPRLGNALVAIIETRGTNYPIGTILEIENLSAVRFPSLSAWLAENIIESENPKS